MIGSIRVAPPMTLKQALPPAEEIHVPSSIIWKAMPPFKAPLQRPVILAGGGVRSSQPALCRDAATVTRLVVNRNRGFKVPELEPAFPIQVTVTDPAMVRAVARALCGLPDVPRGVYHCPALLLGTAYTLHFSVGGRPLPVVTINSTGCETVTGVGPVRRATSREFWQVLSRAIRVKTPSVFGGDNPGSGCRPPSTHMTKIEGCPGVARPGAEVAAPAGAASS